MSQKMSGRGPDAPHGYSRLKEKVHGLHCQGCCSSRRALVRSLQCQSTGIPSDTVTDNNTSQCPGQVIFLTTSSKPRTNSTTTFASKSSRPTTSSLTCWSAACFLPVALVWPLNMSFKLKRQVVFAFSFRLPLVVISILVYSPCILEELSRVRGATVCRIQGSAITADHEQLVPYLCYHPKPEDLYEVILYGAY